jgi:hypothetical protein
VIVVRGRPGPRQQEATAQACDRARSPEATVIETSARCRIWAGDDVRPHAFEGGDHGVDGRRGAPNSRTRSTICGFWRASGT